MSKHEALVRLRHMRDYGREAVAIISGKGRSDLDHDRLLVLSLTRLLGYLQRGWESAIRGTYTGHNPRVLDGEAEAHLIALACSEPPDQRESWTMQLLADRLVALRHLPHLSDETVRLTLKKTNSSRG